MALALVLALVLNILYSHTSLVITTATTYYILLIYNSRSLIALTDRVTEKIKKLLRGTSQRKLDTQYIDMTQYNVVSCDCVEMDKSISDVLMFRHRKQSIKYRL